MWFQLDRDRYKLILALSDASPCSAHSTRVSTRVCKVPSDWDSIQWIPFMYIAKVNADGKGGGKGASEQRKARLACLTCQPWDALTAYFGELADKEAVCRSLRYLVVVLSIVSYISWKGETKYFIFVTFCLASNPLWCCMFKLDLTSKSILQDVLWYWVLGFRQSHPQPVYLKALFVHLPVGVRWRPGKWPVALGDAWLEQWL